MKLRSRFDKNGKATQAKTKQRTLKIKLLNYCIVSRVQNDEYPPFIVTVKNLS